MFDVLFFFQFWKLSNSPFYDCLWINPQSMRPNNTICPNVLFEQKTIEKLIKESSAPDCAMNCLLFASTLFN